MKKRSIDRKGKKKKRRRKDNWKNWKEENLSFAELRKMASPLQRSLKIGRNELILGLVGPTQSKEKGRTKYVQQVEKDENKSKRKKEAVPDETARADETRKARVGARAKRN